MDSNPISNGLVIPDVERTMTGAAAILYALEQSGITHLFVNLGSDHPAFLAAFASKAFSKLRIFTSPNEMVALSAASGFAQLTGEPAAVLVHVECGTQALAGAVHNVCKARVPVMILAGMVPVTMEGEMVGSRNEYIHWIQDVPDQRAIVRQYMKYEQEIRVPHNAIQTVLRAVQFIKTVPHGPAYLMASREALELEVPHPEFMKDGVKPTQCPSRNQAVEAIELPAKAVDLLMDALSTAERPLIITSYSGRSVRGFEALRAFAQILEIPVHESAPRSNNFPTTSYLHQGHVWNSLSQLPALAEADVVIVIDSDVPWIPAQSNPHPNARIFHLDSDPLKPSMTLWSLPCEKRWQCDSDAALEQLSAAARNIVKKPQVQDLMKARKKRLQGRFAERLARLEVAEALPTNGKVTVPYFMARFREATKHVKVIALNESTTNLPNVADHLHHDEPLTMLTSGAGSLGWYSGAAIGVSLALQSRGRDDELVVCFTGDGTWLFGVPSSAYWMAKRYEMPFLTVVWNNGGWCSPKNACLKIHPELSGTKGDDLMVSLSPSPSFGIIAEGASGAWWTVVEDADRVDSAIAEGIRVVREERRCALIEVVIPKI